ncbi:uncharacterized protein [Epargyreus clarus]|uniref:uncharacterized protein isoform X2 n=1 Tax=Epargyreus clarus TaxID=520877 RepID=UPI003C30B11B
MSRDPRTNYYNRDRDWDRGDYRYDKKRSMPMKRSRSPPREAEKRMSRSPRVKNDKDLDENILSEISKLPEPSELWDNQFQEPGFSGPPAAFPPEAPNYGPNYQAPYSSGIYDDFPSIGVPQAPHPPDMATWNQMSLPPPPVPPTMFVNNVEDQIKKEAAIESEMRHQKAALSKQREDYIKKAGILKKELDTLKDQRNELRGDAKRSPSPDTKRFLKENTKLQLEIQNKLKTINNVVDMLNGIIGEEAQEHHDSDESNERATKRKSRSPSNKKFNYVYYDPEMHWCRVCNEFPPTAKDYLNHLHSPAHHKMAAAHMEAPWHTVTGVNEGFPSFQSAPTKRTPIRGLQFFVPSTAWYCKLCDQFIGDLHCASAHLKSVVHSKNYTNFVEQNPHWETDWMSDRQKAFEKARASNKLKPEEKQYAAHTITFSEDGFHTKTKDHPVVPDKRKKDKRKKKRKHSSSSSSSTNSSDSEPVKKKKSKKEKVKLEPDDKSLTEWMSSIQMDRLNDHDRKILDTFKQRDMERQSRREAIERRDELIRRRDRIERREDERRDERRDDRRDERRDGDRRDDRRDDERRDDDRRDDDRRDERRASANREGSRPRASPRSDYKKPEIRKMPFIGKMPVYKNLNKTTKTEEQKKEEQKKKEEEEASKKRREVMDAEIQKKVAEFKEKIAKAQLERGQAELPPPAVAIPTQLGAPPTLLPPAPPPAPPPPPAPAAQPPAAQTPALPKDFQDALDIIFPTEVKQAASEIVQAQQELFGMSGLPPFPLGMAPFPQLSLLGQPPPLQPHMMMGFEHPLAGPLFPPRAQLYDAHVPLVPGQKRPNSRPNKNGPNKGHGQKHQKQNRGQGPKGKGGAPDKGAGPAARNKEELDELAMLGIDASDVGAM